MGDVWRLAVKSLVRKWSRTCLTVGSITIGVTLVVIVSVISNVGTQAVSAELDSLGMSGLSISAEEDGAALSEESLQVIRSVSGVDTAMPLMTGTTSATLRGISQNVLLCGVDAGSAQVVSITLKHGRLLSRGDVKGASMVCVVDEAFAKEAYARGNIVGKSLLLRIDGTAYEFEIVGVAEAGSSLLQNLNSYVPGIVLVPYTTVGQLTGKSEFDQIAVRAQPGADLDQVETQVLSALERASGVRDGYTAENLSKQKDRLNSLMDIVTLILTIISGISLLVSGLGIMTIMLVSVQERVREIGIKKAIGASGRRILFEFLAESVVISLLGSVVGILLGGGAAWIGLRAFGMPFSLSPVRLLGLIGFCVGIGALFGVYPAVKASKLWPVEALRQD